MASTAPKPLSAESDASVRVTCLTLAGNAPTVEQRVREAQAMYDFVVGTTVTGSSLPIAPEA